MKHISTKVIDIGSAAFRQWRAKSHCRFIHGYNLRCKLWFTSAELDENNWVYDFGACKAIKELLEEQFDHKTVVAADDPELETFKQLNKKGIIQLRVMDDGVGIERTAEWIYDKVNTFLKDTTNSRVTVSRVEVWEHDRNSASVEGASINVSAVNTPVDISQLDYKSYMDYINNIIPEETSTGMQPLEQIPDPDLSGELPPQPLEDAPELDLPEIPEAELNPEDVIPEAPQPPPSRVGRAAPVGNKPSSGKGNWFKGTSWGD